jgi:hypothetical protein
MPFPCVGSMSIFLRIMKVGNIRDWGDIFGSITLAAALADRLAGNSEVILLDRSFRTGKNVTNP